MTFFGYTILIAPVLAAMYKYFYVDGHSSLKVIQLVPLVFYSLYVGVIFHLGWENAEEALKIGSYGFLRKMWMDFLPAIAIVYIAFPVQASLSQYAFNGFKEKDLEIVFRFIGCLILVTVFIRHLVVLG